MQSGEIAFYVLQVFTHKERPSIYWTCSRISTSLQVQNIFCNRQSYMTGKWATCRLSGPSTWPHFAKLDGFLAASLWSLLWWLRRRGASEQLNSTKLLTLNYCFYCPSIYYCRVQRFLFFLKRHCFHYYQYLVSPRQQHLSYAMPLEKNDWC